MAEDQKDDKKKDDIGKILDRRFVPKNTLLIEEGQPASYAYYLEKGRAEVFTTDIDGRKIALSELESEDIFGEMALLTRGRRTASVRTLEDSTVVKITPEDFRRSYSSSNKIFKKLLVVLVDRLIEANHHITEQHKTIADFEEAAHLTVANVGKSIPEDMREKFAREVKPILEHLRAVLKKYKDLTPKKMEEIDREIAKTGKKLEDE
ncbi:MAG: hypothetical protein EA357_05515 [Micavibrio sp.]|nr:MAG: hypothetical protein EA357_05515 [Micavibrio sp.]